MNIPDVSVIIPAFNAAPFIEEAVNSALNSQGVTVEVLVIDDESTDTTWQVLEKFGNSIRKFRRPRGGPYKSRNFAATQAQAKWLAFLDADDLWAPDKLAKQIALADDQTGMVYTDRMNFSETSGVEERFSDSVDLWEGEVFEKLLLGNFITLSSVLLRRSWFEWLGGFSESHFGSQDWDFWLRYSSSGGTVKLLSEPVTRYREHSGQMTHLLDKRTPERCAVIQRALNSPSGRHVDRRLARKALANVWEFAARQVGSSHQWKGLAWHFRAAYHWPWNVGLYKSMAKCCLGRN